MSVSKYLTFVFAFTLFSLFSLNAIEINEIKERGYLRVAMTAVDQKPFYYRDKAGEMAGLDVQIAKGLAKSLNVRLEINREAQSFGALIPLVESGVVDCAISKLSRTLARSQRVIYSNPYITFKQGLLFNRVELAKRATNDEALVDYIKNFTGKLGVIQNSSYARYAKQNFPNATVIGFPSWEEVVTALFDGYVIAAYRDNMELDKIIRSRGDAALLFRPVILQDTRDDIAIAMQKGSHNLAYYVNLYLYLNLPDLDSKYILENY